MAKALLKGAEMADENTTIPAGDAAEVPPEAAASAPSAAAEIKEVSSPVAATPPPTAPPVSTTPATPIPRDAEKHEKMHDVPHSHFRWHADVLVDGHDVYQGIVKDISVKGANLFIEHNLQNAKLVKLHIHVPPLDTKNSHDVLEVSGKVNSTIYDGSEDCFRSGISFDKFTLESDLAYLKSRIAEH